MKILILGGTGAIGRHLVQLLSVDETNHVYLTSRSYRTFNDKNVHCLHGNALNLKFLKKHIENKWDVIVDFMLYNTESFRERVDLFLNSTNHYIFISSARVYANSKKPITENSTRLLEKSDLDNEFLESDEYSLTKAKQENMLIHNLKQNWTIIRPYITYSKHRLQLGVLEKEDWLYRALKGRTIVFSKEMYNKRTTMTYGLDVSKGIFNLLGKETAKGEAYHITFSKSILWSEVIQIYTDVLHKKIGIKPKFELQDLNTFIKHHHAKEQIIYDRMYNRDFNTHKISNYSNVSTFTDVKKGLEMCLKEFLENPSFKEINWLKEAIKDRQTKERASLSEIGTFKQKMRYFLYRYIKQRHFNK